MPKIDESRQIPIKFTGLSPADKALLESMDKLHKDINSLQSCVSSLQSCVGLMGTDIKALIVAVQSLRLSCDRISQQLSTEI